MRQHDKYCVQFTKERQCSHMVDRSYPQWFNDVFKSENTSEHKSEDCGKYTGSCDNSGKRSFLKVIDQAPPIKSKSPCPTSPNITPKIKEYVIATKMVGSISL